MDFETIIYILVIVLPLLGRLFGNKKKNQKPKKTGKKRPNAEESKPSRSLQDILQEISQQYTGKEDRKKVPAEEEDEVEYGEELQDDDEINRVYEDATPADYKKLDDMVSIDEKPLSKEKPIIKSTSSVASGRRNYARDIFRGLTKKDEVRKAIIYKEILERKHF